MCNLHFYVPIIRMAFFSRKRKIGRTVCMLLIVTDIVDFIVLKDAFIVVKFTYNAWLLSSENYTKLKINFPTKICDERAHMVSGCHVLKDQWTLRVRCLSI